MIGSDKVFLEPVSLHIDQSEYYQALAEVDIPLVNHKWIISMPSDVKNVDDSFMGYSIGIESSIVKIGDCSTDDINVNLEFYFGDQLISNENFRVSMKWFFYRHDRQCPPNTEQLLFAMRPEQRSAKILNIDEQLTVRTV